MQVRQDEHGLPVVEWREETSLFKRVRRCRIDRGRDGTLLFVSATTGATTGRMRMLAGGAAGVVGFYLGLLLAGLLGTAIGGQSGFGALNVVAVPGFGLGIGFVAWRFVAGWVGGETHETDTRPWEALQVFMLTDDQTFLRRPKTLSLGGGIEKPAEPVSMLVADFGSATLTMVVAAEVASQEKMAAYHMVLTREFIERRGEHLKRLAAESRQARMAEAGGERHKVI